MPIYEFYCCDCHTIYNFFARSLMQIVAAPACPKCGRRELEKQVSRFAISRGLSEKSSESDPPDGVDEAAMAAMASKLDSLDENDPKAMASAMREVMKMTGMNGNATLQEAIRRMESGDDPDQVEADLGADLDANDMDSLFGNGPDRLGKIRRMLEPPNVDPELYDL
jgi:putative FmdB family regulatory protein